MATEFLRGPGTRLLSVAGYRPRRVVDNDEICTYIDSSDEWIRARTGIRQRRWADEEETVTFMGTEAGRVALERAAVEPHEVAAVIVSTVTHLCQTPGAAPLIAAELGIVGVPAFDVSAACAGFCYCVGLADSMIRSGAAAGPVLVVASERLTDISDLHDRSTAFLFADGAGAVVVGEGAAGIGPAVWGSDGRRSDVVGQRPYWSALAAERYDGPWPALRMAGQELFRWAIKNMVGLAEEAMKKAGVTAGDLGAFVPHQANGRITEALAKRLELPDNVAVAWDVAEAGNTSSASIPLAMDRMIDSGQAKSGDLALLMGFGSGLVYGAQVVALP
ncbi:ketoacyl-ACP synthase III [Dactylosporangium roseum]|uniref:Ketoacyl-ACP synthase III n=1 Tax=Dactylosporangium roseum TaxID=47989 RepID=A0ABY5ZEL0_9ACTN|nr:beta-ketoacyl-ACP synthase III [Dactylosporangium roseum]UWZ39388.1 ketoacyl-ACP synthase III [Dactylosporangium roseum]